MSLETVTRKEKNMQSSNVKEQIPLKILGNKARVLQMEMKLISSTPIRHSEMRNMVNESFQVGSPILRINSTDRSPQINENKSKEVVPANANFSLKSSSLESKNVNNPKSTPYHHMILYSSDEDAIMVTRKKLQKRHTRKRRNVPFMEDTDSDISSKCAKTNVNFAENIHIDRAANGEENNVQLINTEETNTNKRGTNEKRIEDNNINKKTKRKYTKKMKTDDIITVQSNEAEVEAVRSKAVVDRPGLETLNSPKNKLNKETINTVLKAKNSVTKTLDKAAQLNVSDNEIDRLEKKTKSKLHPSKTKLDIIAENLRRNDNDNGKEISQESSNGARKSSRQRMPSQAYWIARSISQSSDCADAMDLPRNTEDKKVQFSKNRQPTAVSSKTKLTKQQKQTREVITNGIKKSLIINGLMSPDPDNVQANGDHGSNKATANPNSDLDSCNNDAQAEANVVHEKESKNVPVKQKKKDMQSHSKKHSSFNVRKQPESDNLHTSPTDTDANTDNIPSDSLVTDFHADKTSKSAHTNAESIIDNYSFKEIALAQRHLAEIEHSKQPEYFGQFPQTYHTHSNNPNLSIGINISHPDFISGVLEIVPGGRKQQEYPKKNNMSFFILEGNAEVCVGNISKILRIGDSFFVPNNTPYYIINLNKTKRLLILFTKHSAT